MKISRPLTLATAVALSAALGLSACASGGGGDTSNNGGNGSGNGPATQDTDAASKLVGDNVKDRGALDQGGTLTLPMAEWPTNLNRWNNDGNLSAYNDVSNATDPSFYDYSPSGEITPRTDYLLEMPKVEEKGGKEVVTYKLNPKAKWNDGTPIDHTAFEATWKAQAQPMSKGGYNNISTTGYEDIESVAQGAAANEVVVTFKNPYYPVTEIFGSVMHPKVGASTEAFNTSMKSDFHPEWHAGPFTLDSLDQTTKTFVLKPNPNWWGEKPLLNKVVFRQMEDSATLPAFRNGEIDMTGVANKSRYTQVQGAPNLELRRSQRTSSNVLVFNTKADGLDDVNVRKAMWQAIDRDEWKKVRYNGLNWTEKPANSAMYFTFQPEFEDNMPVKFSVEDAKKTLTDAGYALGSDGYFAKGGKKLSVKYTDFGDDPLTTSLAQLLQKQMKAAGIDLQLDIKPGSAFGEVMAKKQYGVVGMAWGSGSPVPLVSACQFYCSDSTSNMAGGGTPEIDKQLKALGAIKDKAAQAKAINAAEKAWMGQVYGQLPISNGPAISAVHKGLANYGPAMFRSITPHWENVGWEKGSQHK